MHYFAFGSNMYSARLRARVGEFPQGAAAQLRGYALEFHKRGGDGSGKCDAAGTDDARHVLHGVVYRLSSPQRAALDAFEGAGYSSADVSVSIDGFKVPAFMYVAEPDYVDPGLSPFEWYKHLVLAGAREFLLPRTHLRKIARVAAQPDPDRGRHRQNMAVISCTNAGPQPAASTPGLGAHRPVGAS